MRGVKVTDDVKRRFAQRFLETGSVRLSAKHADLPERTAYDLADDLEADADFAAARKRLYDHAIDRAEAAVMRSIDVAAERVEQPPVPVPVGDDEDGGARIQIIDNGHNYARAVADLYRSLLMRRKNDHDMKPENKGETGPVEVVIRMADAEKPDGSSG